MRTFFTAESRGFAGVGNPPAGFLFSSALRMVSAQLWVVAFFFDDFFFAVAMVAPEVECRVIVTPTRAHFSSVISGSPFNLEFSERFRAVRSLVTVYARRIFSIAFPFASSSINLSMMRMFFVNGSSISSTRIPHTVPLTCRLPGWMRGA